jgi:hypothetical protein
MCFLLICWIYAMDRKSRADVAELTRQAREDRDTADKRQKVLQDELATEQRLRVDDAQRYTKLALELQGQAVDAVQSLKSHLGEYRRVADLVEDVVKLLRDEDDHDRRDGRK